MDTLELKGTIGVNNQLNFEIVILILKLEWLI